MDDARSVTVEYRVLAAQRVYEAGGIAALVRSVTPGGRDTAHTARCSSPSRLRCCCAHHVPYCSRTQGSGSAGDHPTPIPAAAISTSDADFLERMARRGWPMNVKLIMHAQNLPPTTSYNVIAEVRGSAEPDEPAFNESVVISAHLDSWDVGRVCIRATRTQRSVCVQAVAAKRPQGGRDGRRGRRGCVLDGA